MRFSGYSDIFTVLEKNKPHWPLLVHLLIIQDMDPGMGTHGVSCVDISTIFSLNLHCWIFNIYLSQEQRKSENEGVTEDDVNEIKNDISAFRFELIEIMRASGMNTQVSDLSKSWFLNSTDF